MNCFRFLLVSSLLLTGHLPALSTLLFRVALSFTNLSHWNIRWSTVCMPCLHGHSGLPINFNRYKSIEYFHGRSKFGLKFRFTACLPSTLAKKFFGNRSFRCFLQLTLPFSYAFYPVILFYSAFRYPAVCYLVFFSCLLRELICDFVTTNSDMNFHPFKFYFPVLFVQVCCPFF